jgi:hypothetical protein
MKPEFEGALLLRDDDIDDVRKEESSRGKRHPSRSESRSLLQKRNRLARELLAIRDRREFEAAIIEYGVQRGSPEFALALKAWSEYGDT